MAAFASHDTLPVNSSPKSAPILIIPMVCWAPFNMAYNSASPELCAMANWPLTAAATGSVVVSAGEITRVLSFGQTAIEAGNSLTLASVSSNHAVDSLARSIMGLGKTLPFILEEF